MLCVEVWRQAIANDGKKSRDRLARGQPRRLEVLEWHRRYNRSIHTNKFTNTTQRCKQYFFYDHKSRTQNMKYKL